MFIYLFKTLISLRILSSWWVFCVVTCEWNNLHFFEGKVVPPYSDQFIAFIWITITRPRNWRQFLWVSLLWSNCKFIMLTASFDFKPNTRIYELILILSRYNRGILAHFENSLDFKSTLKSTLISKDISGTFWKQPLFQDNLNFSQVNHFYNVSLVSSEEDVNIILLNDSLELSQKRLHEFLLYISVWRRNHIKECVKRHDHFS